MQPVERQFEVSKRFFDGSISNLTQQEEVCCIFFSSKVMPSTRNWPRTVGVLAPRTAGVSAISSSSRSASSIGLSPPPGGGVVPGRAWRRRPAATTASASRPSPCPGGGRGRAAGPRGGRVGGRRRQGRGRLGGEEEAFVIVIGAIVVIGHGGPGPGAGVVKGGPGGGRGEGRCRQGRGRLGGEEDRRPSSLSLVPSLSLATGGRARGRVW